MARTYKSPVREARAAQTREALLDACEALLLAGPIETVTLPLVAERAGVTKPTAYAHFPDPESLMAGLIDHVRGRIGMDLETLAAIPPAELGAAVRANYKRFDAHARLLRRVMEAPSYDRLRLARKVDRAAATLPAWRGLGTEAVLRRRLGALYLLVSPASWRWLHDTWGLSDDDAAATAAWAMEALVTAIQNDPKRRRT